MQQHLRSGRILGQPRNAGPGTPDAQNSASAGDDESKTDTEDQELINPPDDVDDTPDNVKHTKYTVWSTPIKDNVKVLEHIRTFLRETRRQPWYRPLHKWLEAASESHSLTTIPEWTAHGHIEGV